MCAYKPPSKRFPIHQDYNKSFEKKDLETLISELRGLLDIGFERNTYLNDITVTLEKLSSLFVTIGNIQFTKQLGWNKEILQLLSLIGRLPYDWLVVNDFRNMSRFITKASMEKHLAIFNGEEVVGVFVLLLRFLKCKGQFCRGSSSAQSSERVTVIHEVMRAVAQILMLSANKLNSLRIETLQVVLFYSRERSLAAQQEEDVSTRFAAIDAIGNVFLTHDKACAASNEGSEMLFAGTTDAVGMRRLLSAGYPDCSDVVPTTSVTSTVDRAILLARLHTECVASVLDGMTSCSRSLNCLPVQALTSAEPETAMKFKLLVSSLRALTHALRLASKSAGSAGSSSSKEGKLDFSRSALTLSNAAASLVTALLPKIAVPSSLTAATVSVLPEVKVWLHSVHFLSAVAAFRHKDFLFAPYLPESPALDQDLARHCDSFVAQAQLNLSLTNSGSGAESSTSQSLAQSTIPPPLGAFNFAKYFARSRSLLLVAAASPQSSVRAAAAQCLQTIISVKGEAVPKATKVRVLRVLALSLATERNEDVVAALLSLLNTLLGSLPLQTVPASKVAPEQSAAALEQLAWVAMWQVAALAAEYTCRSTSDASSVLAMTWLTDYCKAPVQLLCVHKVLRMSFSVGAKVLTATSATAANTLLGKSPNRSGSSWRSSGRGESASEAAPQLAFPFMGDLLSDSITGGTVLGASASSRFFLAAMTEICTCSSLSQPLHVAHNLAIRTLCSAIVQRNPELCLLDQQWLLRVVERYEASESALLRLQASRMIAALLGRELQQYNRSPLQNRASSEEEDLRSFEEMPVAARTLKKTTEVLLKACNEADHLVRGQAAAAFGSLLPSHWKVLRAVPSSRLAYQPSQFDTGRDMSNVKKDAQKVEHRSYDHYVSSGATSVQAVVLHCLLKGTVDTIGTVRGASFKALGDIISNRGLVDAVSVPAAPLTAAEAQLVGYILKAVQVGCRDTKLAVRIQAAWVMGNLLSSVLPYRLQRVQFLVCNNLPASTDLSAHSAVVGSKAMDCDWLGEEVWVAMVHMCAQLLSDSEKILSTAVRGYGVLISGLSPQLSGADHSTLIEEFRLTLLNRFIFPPALSAPSLEWTVPHIAESLRVSMETHSHKLMFSVCQGLCLTLIVTLPSPRCEGAVVDAETEDIRRTVWVLLGMLRAEDLKIQVQAAQGLLFVICSADMDLREACCEGDDHVLTRVLDTVLTVASAQREAVPPISKVVGSGSLSRLSEVAGSKEADAPVEVLALKASRGRVVERYLLLLLWALVRRANDVVPGRRSALRSQVAQLVAHYGTQFSRWLRRLAASTGQFQLSEVSLGLAVPESPSHFSFLAPIDHAPVKTIVSDIAGSLLAVFRQADPQAEDQRGFQHSFFSDSASPGSSFTVSSISISQSDSQLLGELETLSGQQAVAYSVFDGLSTSFLHHQCQAGDESEDETEF